MGDDIVENKNKDAQGPIHRKEAHSWFKELVERL